MSLRITRARSGGIWMEFSYMPPLLDRLKAEVPKRERTYDPDGKRWYIGRDYAAWAESIAREYFPDDEPSDQGPGEKTVSRPRYSDTAFGRLFILPDAPPCVVDAAYKALAKAMHPDVCKAPGAAEAMTALNDAYRRIKGGR